MDNLAPELIHQIVDHLYWDNNPDINAMLSLVCVSRVFQLAVEPYHFSSSPRITNRNLSELAYYYRFEHRRSALREISYEIILPMYDRDSYNRFESRRARFRNDDIFSEAMVDLFQVLSSWKCNDVGAGICLTIKDVYSYSDEDRRSQLRYTAKPWKELGHARYAHSHLRLVPVSIVEITPKAEETDLSDQYYIDDKEEEDRGAVMAQYLDVDAFMNTVPRVPRVTGFFVEQMTGRRLIDAASLVRLAGRLPNLRRWLLGGVRDDGINSKVTRLRMRAELGHTFLELCVSQHFHNLREFVLCISSPQPLNHNYSGYVVHPALPQTDFLSLGLHAISRLPNLETLRIATIEYCAGPKPVCLSPAIFWPCPGSDFDIKSRYSPSLQGPFWLSLKDICIKMSACTPFGGWYTTRDPTGSHRPPLFEQRLESMTQFDTEYESDVSDELPFMNRSVTPPPREISIATPWVTQDEYNYNTTFPTLNVFPDASRLFYRDDADFVDTYQESRLAGDFPVDPFRTILDPETFTPLILALANMISVARRNRLDLLRFDLDFGFSDGCRIPHPDQPEMTDIDVFFLRRGNPLRKMTHGWYRNLWFDEPSDSNDQDQSKSSTANLRPEYIDHVDRDRLIIRVRDDIKWNDIEDKKEVRKALREAVGENGIIRVDTLHNPEPPMQDGKYLGQSKLDVHVRYLD